MVERRTPEREVGGSILTRVAVLCPGVRLKVLVIPRKWWLRPYKAKILFTETLKNKTKRLRRGYPTIHSLET